jgi:hypothetical protein
LDVLVLIIVAVLGVSLLTFAEKAHVIISIVILGPMYGKGWAVARQEWMEHLGLKRETLGSAWRVSSDVVQAISGARNVGREIEEEKRKESGLYAIPLDRKQAEKRALGLMEREMKVAESRALAGEDVRKYLQTKLWDIELEIVKNQPVGERQSMIRSGLAELQAKL